MSNGNKGKLFCDTKLLSRDKIGQVLFQCTIYGVSPRVGCGRQIRFLPGLQADLFKRHGNMVKLDDNVLLLDLLFTFIQKHYSSIAGMLRPFPCEIPPWNGNLWKSMEFHGNPWKSMEFHGTSMEYPWSIHGVPWNAMEFAHGVCMEFHGMPWSSAEFHEVLMEVHGIPWNAVGFPEVPMEFHGMP